MTAALPASATVLGKPGSKVGAVLVEVEDAAADATVAGTDEIEGERDIDVVLIAGAVLPDVSVVATAGVVVRLMGVVVVVEIEAVSVEVIVVIEMVGAVLVPTPLAESLELGLPPPETLLAGTAAFGHRATTPLPSKNS